MWGSRYFTARYWTSRFFSATGAESVIIPTNVVETIGLFKAPQTTAMVKATSMNGLLKAPKTIGQIK